MWVGMGEVSRLATQRLPGILGGVGILLLVWLLGFRMQLRAEQRRYKRRIEEELSAYARLEILPLEGDDVINLAIRVSQLIAEKSAFRRVAMLAKASDGRLVVCGSAGMDRSMVRSMSCWGEQFGTEQRGGFDGEVRLGGGGLGLPVGIKSFAVTLGEMSAEASVQRAIVVPLWAINGRLLGALAVGADGVLNARRTILAEALEPMERLGFKLERAMENAALKERLQRAERSAGLGMMAEGLALALANPLTAVLGFAELIVDTAGDARVKEDAGIIVQEALRMRQTVEMLLEFWQPAANRDELVDIAELARGLAGTFKERPEGSEVQLIVEAGEDAAYVRGSRERLRKMMEHLLNNAVRALQREPERVVRVSVSCRESKVHLVVSDTGPGFGKPERVFALSDSIGETGFGLSICYGIVREHGGEIRAFNLHPHGAAIAVELPAATQAKKTIPEAAERALA
jgi:signal transduction histidine kinase